MILPIYIYGHSVLRKKCEDIDSSFPNLDTIINNMFETMHNANGIGLAAPQIGLSINLFVIDLSPFSDDHPDRQSATCQCTASASQRCVPTQQ